MSKSTQTLADIAKLHGRVALITGGGTGIGAATAVELARCGATVQITGRRRGPLEETQRRIDAAGGRCGLHGVDVSDTESVAELVAAVVREAGRLDILVNNAGLYEPGLATETDLDAWDRHFDLNARGLFALSVAAYPRLKETGGVVVNVLSNLARRPVPGVTAYAASKAAARSVTESLALEWAAEGIRVVSVSPGVVATPMHDDERLEMAAGFHPLGRVGQAEEVARAIRFLASDESSWTTGSNLDVGGGIHLA